MKINFFLNHIFCTVDTDPLRSLADVLRRDFNQTDVKQGCGEGECGACAVLVEASIVHSCIYPVVMAQDKKILTLSGILDTAEYQAIKKGFSDAGSVQCGFCTPGIVIVCYDMFKRNVQPSRDMLMEHLSGNLCRCTGYNSIFKGVELAFEYYKKNMVSGG
jgi:carbon-monoxide dehydrogenase small subunit